MNEEELNQRVAVLESTVAGLEASVNNKVEQIKDLESKVKTADDNTSFWMKKYTEEVQKAEKKFKKLKLATDLLSELI